MHRKYKKAKLDRKNDESYKYYLNFCLIRNNCKIEPSRCYELYINNIRNNINKNPRSFWNFIESKRSNREFPNALSLDDETANNSFDISNLFAKYFSNVYT